MGADKAEKVRIKAETQSIDAGMHGRRGSLQHGRASNRKNDDGFRFISGQLERESAGT